MPPVAGWEAIGRAGVQRKDLEASSLAKFRLPAVIASSRVFNGPVPAACRRDGDRPDNCDDHRPVRPLGTLVAAADIAPNHCRSMRSPAILDAPAANLGLRIAPLAKERLLK